MERNKKTFWGTHGLFSRILSLVLAVAMVLTMGAFSSWGQTMVKAEDAGIKLYFELPEGTTVADWAANVWGTGVNTTGSSEIQFRPEAWGDGDKYPTLLADGEKTGWGYVTVTGTIEGMQFVNQEAKKYECWNPQIAEQKLTEAYFSPSDNKWYEEASKTTEVKAAEVATVKLYFELPEGTTVTDWAANVWGTGVNTTGSSEIQFRPAEWGDGDKYPTLLADGEKTGWGYVTVTGTIKGMQFVNQEAKKYECWNSQIAAQKLTEAYFSPSDEKWYKEASKTTEVKAAEGEKPEAPAKSDLAVTDQVRLVVDDNTYDMDVFMNGVFEASVEDLAAGTHAAKVQVNGTTKIETEVNVETAGQVYFRLKDGNLQNSLQETLVHTAALTGTFTGLELESPIGAWDPADANAELTYLGGGIYSGTFKFAALANDTDIEYKIAFDDGWDYSIGEGGGSDNVKVKVPAGATSITVWADEVNKGVYDSVGTENLGMRVTLAGSMNGWGDSVNDAKNDFVRISNGLYRYQVKLSKGKHEYKCMFNGSDWLEGSNYTLDVENDDTVVIIVYNTSDGKLYDSLNNAGKLSVMLGMSEAPAEMKITDNLNGTTTFIATGEAGQAVKLFYAKKSDAEAGNAFTEVDLGTIEKSSVSSDPIFFGDGELDIVYYYMIDDVKVLDASKESVTVNENTYSNYKRAVFAGRKVNVPGTFPGPSWDAASNQMTYAGNGLYTYTFKDVAPANYEYKIAMGSWAENYGVAGKPDGSNYGVTVPSKQDVTVYYSDISTHLSVTSLNYKFVEISVEGTNVAKTKLTDDGLTGIYSAKIVLPAGTYSDVKLTGDSEKSFDEFTIAEAKEVTFYYAPAYEIYYNDATTWTSDDKSIVYNTKKTAYKSIYGAVPTDTDVTFAISADDKVTAAKLVIQQNSTKVHDLAKSGSTWSVTTKFDTLGEYNYFFVLYSGSAVKVYCDDQKRDYGEGVLTDLTNIVPYDLVVYDKNFKTPDWMKNAVIYQIFPDRFYDGDASNNKITDDARGNVKYEFIDDWYLLPENPEQNDKTDLPENVYKGDGNWSNEIYGGDLKGITKRINYLKALGVTVIYLNPVFESISSHRYDTSNYKKIDPILGTLGDFEELVSVAKNNGMKVVLDGVFNHVSDDSIYFDRYYEYLEEGTDAIGAYPYWAYVYDYMADNKVEQAAAETEAKKYFTEKYGITNYEYTEWFEVYQKAMTDDKGAEVKDTYGLRAGKPVYSYEGWWGYDSMPVIKSTNGSEYQSGTWAASIIGKNETSTAADDSVTQYWLSKGMAGWRLDVANEVSDETWQHFRKSVKALSSDNVIIGEIWDDATEYLMGDMYDSVMNYVFRGAATSYAKEGKASESLATLERIRERYPQEAFYAMMNLVDSHDTTRLLSYLDGIDDDRKDKDTDKAFPSYEKTSDKAKKAQYVVAMMQFTYAGAPTVYYGDELGMVGGDDPDDRRAMIWGKGNEELVTWYAKLSAIRANYPALRTGSVEIVDLGNEALMSYVRADKDQSLLVIMNNSGSAIETTVDVTKLNASALTDLISKAAFTAEGGKVKVSVPAQNGVILVDSAKAVEVSVDKTALAPGYHASYIYDRKESEISSAASSASGSDSSSGGETSDTSNIKTVTNADGSKVETKTETKTNAAGNKVDISTATTKDAAGNITSIVVTSSIAKVAENMSATVVVEKKADGTVVAAKAALDVAAADRKTAITADVIAQLTAAAGQDDVAIELTAKDAAGKTLYTVKVDAKKVTAGNNLYIFKFDSKTGKYVMVNGKAYSVGKDGNLDLSIKSKAVFELMTQKEASDIENGIKKTIKVKNSSKSVKKGKTTKIELDKALDMNNVKKITYSTTKKSVAQVSSTGNITAKGKGTVTIKAKVILKNGSFKTVSMKIAVN